MIAQLREDTLMDAPQETPRTVAASAAWVLARLAILHGRTQSGEASVSPALRRFQRLSGSAACRRPLRLIQGCACEGAMHLRVEMPGLGMCSIRSLRDICDSNEKLKHAMHATA
ncbi:hypothetical protein [Xanthomonas campestris]|uniref:hypothetical protein n=1 Tax=Xanthomonas campestris TaxID=339 RepID=UPI001ED8E707|nr:hypothetical protein [Xanthomonas campestris]MEA9774223.1 hypothetical protein [Xanthomonas campestris pv. raphani]MEA9915506.1 hypothetical protein [Xanthomonas campestris pv. raphani]